MKTRGVKRAAEAADSVSGAGFGTTPRRLAAAAFGRALPPANRLATGEFGVRQRVLLETVERLEEASATAKYHRLARDNVARWAAAASPPERAVAGMCDVKVLPGDWGQVTHTLTKEYGSIFASLNMANAYGPGGGYVEGMVAQEENMFRRTDCHFSLDRADMDPETEEYAPFHTDQLSAADGLVYLDTERPRVCIRGPEDRSRDDLGYEWLPDEDVFPFFELRAAAVDLRDPSLAYDHAETLRRVGAQLDTLIKNGVKHAVLSAFGCGAFRNPAAYVAAAYKKALLSKAEGAQRLRAAHFDIVCFAVFHAGYGPDNFTPFAREFEQWPASD